MNKLSQSWFNNVVDKLENKIKSMFGQGVVRVEGKTSDGRDFILRVKYVGCLSTFDETETFDYVKQQVRSKHGWTVRPGSLRVLGFVK